MTEQHGKMIPCQARSPYTSIFFHERINSFRLKIFKPNVCVCVCACVCVCVCVHSVAQLCLILYGPMDCSLPGSSIHLVDHSPPDSSVHWISQARILWWVVTQGLNLCHLRHLHWQVDFLPLLHLCVCVSCLVMSNSLQLHRL